MSRLQAAVLLFALGVSTSALAQEQIAKHVRFDNPGPYSQQQLEAVSGYHPGAPATAEALTAAAQKLSDTGLFDDIGAEIEGKSMADLVAVFKLKPQLLTGMLPVGFDNFVWLTHDEIEAALHAKVPLYMGVIPEVTTNEDAVAAVLKDTLAAKGITAAIEYETLEPTLQHPLLSIAFRVKSPNVAVGNIKLSGVTPDLVPLVQKAINSTAGRNYHAGLGGQLTSESILQPLLNAGYIDAALSNVSVDPGALANNTSLVVMSATLTAGDSYKVSSITFAGAPLFSAESFAAQAKLHPGDIASRAALLDTLRPIDRAYREQGYMDVAIKADPVKDTASHTVAYAVTVVAGEQYRIHQITPDGIEPDGQAAFLAAFPLKPGDLYSPYKVEEFLIGGGKNDASKGYKGNYKAYAYPATHTVDLYLTLYGSTHINVH